MNEHIKDIERLAIERGGLLLFQPSDAQALVSMLKSEKIEILSVDAFNITSNTTQPIQEHSIDLSRDTEGGWACAIDFIENRKGLGLFFEIVRGE